MHIAIVAAGALLAGATVFISANWPYRHRKIHAMLEDVLTSDVKFTGYHRVYFPRPGFEATGITIRRKTAPAGTPPLGRIESMKVVGTWSDLIMLRRRVEQVEVTGFHIVIPAVGSTASRLSFPAGSSKEFGGPDTMIERMIVHDSILEILRDSGKPLAFPIKQVELTNLHKGEAFTYAVDMTNAIPRGRILARGSMGPIRAHDFNGTPLSGTFAFTGVNLHDVGEISGTLDSRGEFKGSIGEMRVEASETTANFAVQDGKPTRVDGTLQGSLRGANGDLTVQSIELKIGPTTIQARGSIEGSPKKTNFDISVDRGRAEDLMRPFIHRDVPITGPVTLKSHAYLGPPGDGFIARLRLNGSFDVPAEKLTDKDTEKSLSAFSQRAQGKQKNTGLEADPNAPAPGTDVVSSLRGPAKVEDGVASTSHLEFRIPGAMATLVGTFRFHDDAVHLTGDLKMDTDISHTATGFKSFLLKPLAPFFKKKNAGAVIPIAVTGLPGHYKVSQNLAHTK
ncbi:AsmA-like C-terminal region-containing protein [Occallatibacter savannae]|uniref:AsmA-like C-terminal region-containing protein n=1 Tax=Occallatibacter savannae TaxID=1002691 RepID=UPI0013A579BA|nr:AsmA-like C-terminal region-containing protein [Occallatibacter savannae]